MTAATAAAAAAPAAALTARLPLRRADGEVDALRRQYQQMVSAPGYCKHAPQVADDGAGASIPAAAQLQAGFVQEPVVQVAASAQRRRAAEAEAASLRRQQQRDQRKLFLNQLVERTDTSMGTDARATAAAVATAAPSVAPSAAPSARRQNPFAAIAARDRASAAGTTTATSNDARSIADSSKAALGDASRRGSSASVRMQLQSLMDGLPQVQARRQASAAASVAAASAASVAAAAQQTSTQPRGAIGAASGSEAAGSLQEHSAPTSVAAPAPEPAPALESPPPSPPCSSRSALAVPSVVGGSASSVADSATTSVHMREADRLAPDAQGQGGAGGPAAATAAPSAVTDAPPNAALAPTPAAGTAGAASIAAQSSTIDGIPVLPAVRLDSAPPDAQPELDTFPFAVNELSRAWRALKATERMGWLQDKGLGRPSPAAASAAGPGASPARQSKQSVPWIPAAAAVRSHHATAAQMAAGAGMVSPSHTRPGVAARAASTPRASPRTPRQRSRIHLHMHEQQQPNQQQQQRQQQRQRRASQSPSLSRSPPQRIGGGYAPSPFARAYSGPKLPPPPPTPPEAQAQAQAQQAAPKPARQELGAASAAASAALGVSHAPARSVSPSPDHERATPRRDSGTKRSRSASPRLSSPSSPESGVHMPRFHVEAEGLSAAKSAVATPASGAAPLPLPPTPTSLPAPQQRQTTEQTRQQPPPPQRLTRQQQPLQRARGPASRSSVISVASTQLSSLVQAQSVARPSGPDADSSSDLSSLVAVSDFARSSLSTQASGSKPSTDDTASGRDSLSSIGSSIGGSQAFSPSSARAMSVSELVGGGGVGDEDESHQALMGMPPTREFTAPLTPRAHLLALLHPMAAALPLPARQHRPAPTAARAAAKRTKAAPKPSVRPHTGAADVSPWGELGADSSLSLPTSMRSVPSGAPLRPHPLDDEEAWSANEDDGVSGTVVMARVALHTEVRMQRPVIDQMCSLCSLH